MSDLWRRIFARMQHPASRLLSALPRRAVRVIGGGVLWCTRDLRSGLWLADHLVATGDGVGAARIYGRCERLMARKRHVRYKAPLQFRLHRGLSLTGNRKVADPFFDLRPFRVGNLATIGTRSGFECAVAYNGLVVSGQVIRKLGDQPSLENAQVMIDGIPIRTIGLRFRGSIARFRLSVKRPALALFPKRSVLSVRTSDGTELEADGRKDVNLLVPHGRGTLAEELETRGELDKKGRLQPLPEEIELRNSGYLDLYDEVREIFDQEIGRPLQLLYGTLLGQHRDGDIIPWDDDFDCGYWSPHTTPQAVKSEAESIIWKLLTLGYDVVIRQSLRMPFWVRRGDDRAGVHLAMCPIWGQDGAVWSEIKARLPLGPEDFRAAVAELRGTKVYKPVGTEAFLATYYGERWRTPDPAYTNESAPTIPGVQENLARTGWTLSEVYRMKESVAAERRAGRVIGELVCKDMHDLYPLNAFEDRFGW